jgi:hypothetical protein
MKSNILIAIFLPILLIGGAFYVSQQKDSQVLIVNVTLARPPDNDSSRIISQVNASLSYVGRMEVASETSLEMPGITVMVIQNQHEKSALNSIPIPKSSTIYGSYSITVKLTGKIDRNEPVFINTRVVDPSGRDISVKLEEIMLS